MRPFSEWEVNQGSPLRLLSRVRNDHNGGDEDGGGGHGPGSGRRPASLVRLGDLPGTTVQGA